MQTGDDILFTAPGPDFGTIASATTEIVGTPGNGFNVYWIVTHFPIGSVLSGPFPQKGSPNVLDDENYILISWLPAPGASTYDLLVTKDLVLPKQPGQFWLAGGLTETEFRDTGQGLAFYDIAGIRFGAPQEEHVYFNNRDFKQPTLQFIPWPIQVSSIIFEDGSEQNTAGGGGAAAPPNQAVQFNDNGTFAGSPGLTFFQEFNELDIGQEPTAIAIAPPFISSGGPIIISSFATQGISIQAGNGAVVLQPGGGRVGINVAQPQFRLDVAGDINISDPGGFGGFTYRINGVPITAGGGGAGPAGDNYQIQFNGAGQFAASPNLYYNYSDFGVTARMLIRYPFDANRYFFINLSDQYAFLQSNNQIRMTGDGGIQMQATSPFAVNIVTGAQNRFYIGADGNVGIGDFTLPASPPAFKLEVAGDVNIIDPVPYGGSGVGFRLNGTLFAETFYPGRVRLNNTQFIFGSVGSINLGADSGSDTVQMSISQNEITCYVGITVAPYLSVTPVDPNIGSVFLAADSGIICSRPLSLLNLPTSSAGLLPGDVWNNGGVLNIVL